MKFLFMDEKGPQNSFKISNPYNQYSKLSYAYDQMHSYVANVIQIDESNYIEIEKRYKEISEEYLSTRKQLKKSLKNKNKELKGSHLLKENFNYGICSMKKNEILFYRNLLELLIAYNVDNLIFTISKPSIIVSSRLINFLYNLELLPLKPNIYIFKYSLTKYVENEASKEVIKSLLDKNIPTKNLLNLIKKDMSSIIEKYSNIKRTHLQIANFKEIINFISVILNSTSDLVEPNVPVSFNWNQVSWALDLWLLEQNQKHNHRKILFLDEGIDKDIFENLSFQKIYSDCNSKNYIGLQITDMIVVLVGKLISQLNTETKYDYKKPDKLTFLCENYFDLTNDQFELIQILNSYIFERKSQYHFVHDIYFDDSIRFESYISYIASYATFEDFKNEDITKHPENHFKKYRQLAEARFNEFDISLTNIYREFGSIKIAMKKGLVRPL